MSSIWVVNGDDYKESWGAMFATRQEAEAYVSREASAHQKLNHLIWGESEYVKPESVVEIHLADITKPTFYEEWLAREQEERVTNG